MPPASVLDPPAKLDMSPNFADHGFLAGPAPEVLRALQHCKRIMPDLGLRFSSLAVVAAAGRNHEVDMQLFINEGCLVSEDGNIEVLKSPVGDDVSRKVYSISVAQKHSKMFEALRCLEDQHVAYYLLRWSANASRMNYLARTTPATHCSEALEYFDLQVRQTFVEVSGLPLGDGQWEQATVSTRQGGLGLRSAASTADAAYLGSRWGTHKFCAHVREGWAWPFS